MMTKDDINRMGLEADAYANCTWDTEPMAYHRQQYRDAYFAKLVAATEREACVRTIKDHQDRWAVPVTTEDFNEIFDACTNDIRERGL